MLLFCPFFEDGSELVVGDNDVFVNVGNAVDVVQHAAEDGVVTNLQQGLGEVLGQLSQAGGITGGDNYGFHLVLRHGFHGLTRTYTLSSLRFVRAKIIFVYTNLAPLSVLQKWIWKVSVYSGNMRRYSSVI